MKSVSKVPQSSLFSVSLEQICDGSQPLVKLTHAIDWAAFDSAFGPLYCEDNGRPGKPIRLMVGLSILKAMFGESDEGLVEKWVQNPYWQYLCGEHEFQHCFPIEPTSMGKWRKRVESKGLEKLLESSIAAGLKSGTIRREHLMNVNVDTTVQEKAIAFPTDARLQHRMRERLVREAVRVGVELRQTYTRKSKKALIMSGRYRHARQGNRAKREQKKIRIYLGRVLRDLLRKTEVGTRDKGLSAQLALAARLLLQKRDDHNKLYALHAPEVECIAKGKARTKYEFGCKTSFVTSSRGNFFLGAEALHGNPYDGHTLPGAFKQTQRLLPESLRNAIQNIFVDQGYRGHGVTEVAVHVVGRNQKRASASLRRWMRRRSAIEPMIGHAKHDGGAPRNHLLGEDGDRIHALLMAVGYNFRKIARRFSFFPEWFVAIFRINLQIAFVPNLLHT
jgi:IS5 family transposase